MLPTHPFDTALARLDSRTSRVTTDDITALSATAKIDITLVAIVGYPPVAIDLCLHAAHDRGGVRLTPSPGLRVPVALAGLGVAADGIVEPHALAAAPCGCPRQTGADGRHWNPLALALRWHPGLPPNMPLIVGAYMENIADKFEQYCEYGVNVFLAALTAARRRRP